LVLSGAGTYIFTSGSKITTTAGTSIILTDGALAEEILWASGNAVTLGAESTFQGNLVSGSEIVLTNGITAFGTLVAMESILAAGTITDPNLIG
jgi:hypothetical protein